MSKQSDLLVTQLTDSLSGNPEAQLATRHLLSESLASAQPEVIELELHKLQSLPQDKLPSFLRKHRVALFLTLNFLLILALATPSILKLNDTSETVSKLGIRVGTGDGLRNIESELTKDEKLFVFGDSNEAPQNRFLPHFQNNPEDPSALAQYLLDSKRADPKFYRLAETLDPENAFFPFLEAERTLDKAIDRNPAYRGKTTTPGIPRKIISDPQLFEKGLTKLREATQLPTYDSYSIYNQNLKLAILPPETDFPSRIYRLSIKAGRIEDTSFLKFATAIDLQATEDLKNKDSQEIRDLFKLSLQVARHYSREPSSFIQTLVHFSFWKSLSATFSKPDLKKLLTIPQQQQLDAIAQEVVDRKSIRTLTSPSPSWETQLQGAGLVSRLTLTSLGIHSTLAPPLTDADLEPERRFWQAFLERLAALVFTVLFFLLSLVLLNSGKRKKPLNHIAISLLETIPTRTIFASSLLLTAATILIHWTWTRLTPFGALDKSWAATRFDPQGYHLIFLGLLTLASCITFARYFVRKRLAPLHLCKPLPLLSGWPVLFLILAYPLSALQELEFKEPLFKQIPLPLFAIFICWLLWLLFRSFAADRTNRITQKLIVRYTGFLLILPTLSAILSIPLLERSEAKWMMSDHLNSTNEHPYGLNRTEEEITLALFDRQKKLLQNLHELESPDSLQ